MVTAAEVIVVVEVTAAVVVVDKKYSMFKVQMGMVTSSIRVSG